MNASISEPARETPVRFSCGVLVAGGGVAGVAAALAAAREGADVILLEREYLLGGLATLGLVTIYLPLCDGRGRLVMTGLAEELLRLSVARTVEVGCPAWLEGGTEAERIEHRFRVQFNPAYFALDMEKLLLANNVRILYGTKVCSLALDGKRITDAICESKAGRFAISASSFVDATGDADLCELSGAPTALAHPGNGVANWYYYSDESGAHLRILSADYTSPDLPKYNGLTDLPELVIAGHERLMADVEALRASDARVAPDRIVTIPQVRTTRRLDGARVLDESEVFTHFPSSIGLCCDWRKRGPVYELPFETLYSPSIDNLVCAGRCISVTDAMWEITRVIPPCVLTGQAAGTAAAMSCRFASLDTEALRARLHSAGVVTDLSELKG